jgi:hypothetical protein
MVESERKAGRLEEKTQIPAFSNEFLSCIETEKEIDPLKFVPDNVMFIIDVEFGTILQKKMGRVTTTFGMLIDFV